MDTWVQDPTTLTPGPSRGLRPSGMVTLIWLSVQVRENAHLFLFGSFMSLYILMFQRCSPAQEDVCPLQISLSMSLPLRGCPSKDNSHLLSSYIYSSMNTQLLIIISFSKLYFQMHLPERLKTSDGFPGGPVVENLPANAGDMGSIPDPGRCHMLQSK